MRRTISYIVVLLTFSMVFFQSAHSIINGQLDGDDHPYVGAVLQFVDDEPFFCSGVAISESIILTSGHCIKEESVPVGVNFLSLPSFPTGWPSEFHFGFGYVHQDFCIGCGKGLVRLLTHDVAVIELLPEYKLDLERYATLPNAGLIDFLPQHQRLTVVGYGINQVVPTEFWDVARYAADVELIQSNHKVSGEFVKTSSNPSKEKGKFCRGDSGGAVLLGDTLIALPSYGPSIVCSSVGYSNRIDLDYVLEFIDEFL